MATPPAPGLSRLFAGPFPAIEEALLSRFPFGTGPPPAAEHVLLLPSNDLREHLLRRIAARGDGCAAGFQAMTLYDFARRLLKHRGAFPLELPPARMSAALAAASREAYDRAPGAFSGIARTPGFVPALARTLSDLEEGWAGDEVLAAAERAARARGDAGGAARWAEWRRLAAAVARAVSALGGTTRRRIFQDAVAGFARPGYPFRVTLYGFYDFTRLQWTLVEALLDSGLLDAAYVPALFDGQGNLSPAFAGASVTWERLRRAFEGNAEILSDDPHPDVAAVRENLFAPHPAGTEREAPAPLLSPPHGEGQMRLAARAVRAWRDARPGEDVLLVARRLDPGEAAAWERAAQEYGIPAEKRLAVPLAAAPPVRLLVQAVEILEEDYPRRKVVDLLASPYWRLPAADGAHPPRPDLWEVMSRERLVVSGKDWEVRLRAPGRRRRGEEGSEDGEAPQERERRAQAPLLLAAVRALRAALRPVAEARGYAAMARAIRDLLAGGFRFVDDPGPDGERDRRALSALSSILDDVARIPDREIPWPGRSEALAWFKALLSQTPVFAGARGGMREPGAAVAGEIHALRGVTADRVIVLSATEDVVPAQVDEDPLLPDGEREELNRAARRPGLPDALSLMRRNAAQEKLLFALPAASARKGIAFSVPRADAAGAAKRPSRYLLLLLSRFAGAAVFSEEWLARSKAAVASLPRDPFGALSGEGPFSRREEALRRWRAGILPDGGGEVPWRRVAGALRALRGREQGEGLYPGPWPAGPDPAAWSATELDEIATCPYRWFLGRRAGIVPVEEPEEELTLTPAEAGLLAHDLLRILGEEAAAGRGWPDAGPAAARAAARFARRNPTGLPGLFALRLREIARDAAAFVAKERERAASPDAFRVAAVEERFEVPAARGRPAFRGRVDRIDRGPRGEAEIVDYKYRDGKDEKAPLKRMAHGLANQLPVYLACAATLSPPPPEISATLLFLRRGIHRVTVTGGQWMAVREEWEASLRDLLAASRSGHYPPLPHHLFRSGEGASPRYCDACPFRDHCRVAPPGEGTTREAEALARRVASEDALRPLLAHRPPRSATTPQGGPP